MQEADGRGSWRIRNSNSNLQPRQRAAVRTTDLVKTTLVLCLLALGSTTLHTLSYLQKVLDGASFVAVPLHPRVSSSSGQHVSSASREEHMNIVVTTKDTNYDCLQHAPLPVDHVERVQTELRMLQQPSSEQCGRLRRREYWSGGSTRSKGQALPAALSPLAQEIERHQSNCSLPTATFHLDNSFGLGSHLMLWSQAVCNAQEAGFRVQTYNPDWLWRDRSYCNSSNSSNSSDTQSPFLCYFPAMEQRCAGEEEESFPIVNVTDPRDAKRRCRRIREGDPQFLTDFRAASIEYMFQRVSPLVLREAERQMGLVFADTGGVAPRDLVTVHLRWGDKFWEMDLAPISEYMEAVSRILVDRTGGGGQGNNNSTANIYLATEDPKAAAEFLAAVPSGWTVYTDRTVAELGAFRPPKGNRASWTARNTQGRAGLVALASLLVALEADAFVLTTASNWSRLMNQLRRNVLDPRCGNCTRMIDLRPGEW